MSEIKVTNGRELSLRLYDRPIEVVPADIADELLRVLMAYRSAQSRMLGKWADGDDNVKRDLWKALHDCESYALTAIERATWERAA